MQQDAEGLFAALTTDEHATLTELLRRLTTCPGDYCMSVLEVLPNQEVQIITERISGKNGKDIFVIAAIS